MKFSPKSQSEIDADGLFPAGTYDFEVMSAEDKLSNSGNEMIALRLRLYSAEGGTTVVSDYLLEKMAYKLRHAAEACGLLKRYEAGELTADDFEGKAGRVKIKVDPAKDAFPAKNSVGDYIVGETKTSAEVDLPKRQRHVAPAGGGMGHLDEDIPF